MGWGRDEMGGAQKLAQATGSGTLIEGFDSASYGRDLHWCFVPDHKPGSGTGDHWHGGKDARPSTPLGRLVNRFVTGPNRVPIFRSGEKGCELKQAHKRVEERRKNLPVVYDRQTRGWRLFIRMRRGSTSGM